MVVARFIQSGASFVNPLRAVFVAACSVVKCRKRGGRVVLTVIEASEKERCAKGPNPAYNYLAIPPIVQDKSTQKRRVVTTLARKRCVALAVQSRSASQ